MTSNVLLEIAAFTPNAAIAAEHAGAGRVELCSGYSEGGLSPSAGTVKLVRESIRIPVHVMVRPRVGDFIYNRTEKECIIADIEFCKSVGANGVVVGALASNGQVDTAFISKIVQLAHPMSVTFHRAFDQCPKPAQALEQLIDCGVSRVLTSGGMTNVVQGMHAIATLVQQAKGRIGILPGGGVTPRNVEQLVGVTGVNEVHFSGKELIKSSMEFEPKVNLTSQGEVNDCSWYECDATKVEEMLRVLSRYSS